MAFKRSNNKPSVISPRAIHYVTGGLTGGSKKVPLPQSFQPLGPVIVAAPNGLPTGVSVTASVVPPAPPLSYAKGDPPELQITITGTATGDLLVTQL